MNIDRKIVIVRIMFAVTTNDFSVSDVDFATLYTIGFMPYVKHFRHISILCPNPLPKIVATVVTVM